MVVLALSLLITNPAPLEMPRADGYLVTRGDGSRRLEDRFKRLDLWWSQTVDGRWCDEEGRVFLLAHLDRMPPDAFAEEATVTRADYAEECRDRVIGKRDEPRLREAITALSPVQVDVRGRPPRQRPHGFDDIRYWQGTNETVIVCAYLPHKAETWRLAIWSLVEDDDFEDCLRAFEDELPRLPDLNAPVAGKRRQPVPSERELLRRDARHSVAAYENWHAADVDAFTVLDDLPSTSRFVETLTNALPEVRARYVAALPTDVDVTNALCVMRIFATREEYLDALGFGDDTNMTWSAAYWCPDRRELVAYLPPEGEASLLRTIRHEALHQYLTYATTLISVSPWLNEGYAQYFEQGDELVDTRGLVALAPLIPRLLEMDYAAFYSGSDGERRWKYRLAHALAHFIEKGAPKVRFDPFKNLKRDYFAALFETRRMGEATHAAFKDGDTLNRFVAEWTRFWEEQ